MNQKQIVWFGDLIHTSNDDKYLAKMSKKKELTIDDVMNLMYE